MELSIRAEERYNLGKDKGCVLLKFKREAGGVGILNRGSNDMFVT